MRRSTRVFGLVCAAWLCGVSLAAGQEPRIQVGDAVATGFGAYSIKITPTGKHFLFQRKEGMKLRLVDKKTGLDATCGQAEGDVSTANILTEATLTNGVHALVVRPSSEKGSGQSQTAIVDGETAHYTSESNKLHVAGGVVIHDEDPAAGRSLIAHGSSADLLLSPQGTRGDVLRSGELYGPVTTDIHGFRSSSGGKTPFHMQTKSAHAYFDYVARTLTLAGHVSVTSDDPNLPQESGISRETLHFNPDGSVNSVEGVGDPGVTTIDMTGGGAH